MEAAAMEGDQGLHLSNNNTLLHQRSSASAAQIWALKYSPPSVSYWSHFNDNV